MIERKAVQVRAGETFSEALSRERDEALELVKVKDVTIRAQARRIDALESKLASHPFRAVRQ